jgi:DNA ligase 1
MGQPRTNHGMSSGGDAVKAASDFFEWERDFFEEANVSCSETPQSQKNPSDHWSSSDANSQQEGPLSHKPVEHTTKLVNLTPTRMNSNTPKKGRKKGSHTSNKPKKKGRITSSIESGGCKQSTITNFFVRVTTAASKSDIAGEVIVDALKNKRENEFSDISKMRDQNVDQFLQIVNGGMSREYAVSLLEKTKGDVTAAIDIFYSTSENNNVIDVNVNIVQNETIDKSSNTDFGCDSSQATPKMSNLYVQTCLAQEDFVNMLLPIEKYQPIEHG